MNSAGRTILGMLAIIVGLATAGSVWAGRGMGPGDGTGPICNLSGCTDALIEIQGTVATIGYYGEGWEIDTGEEVVTVYGIGPIRFWEAQGVDRPAVGEEVLVKACQVTVSDGTTRLIAFSVTVGDVTIELRDANGYPLWRGGRMGRCR